MSMASKRLHIIITGEEGSARSLTISKKCIRYTILSVLLLTSILTFGTRQGLRFYQLQTQADSLANHLAETSAAYDSLSLEKKDIIEKYESNIKQLIQEREELLEGSISKLDKRSKVIRSVMDHIGVEIETEVEDDSKHSGGPFIEYREEHVQELLNRSDHYLDVLNRIPLGRPIQTSISSIYGRRNDPIKDKTAFHSGIDFRGKTGDKIFATADGIAKIVTHSKGRGNYVTIAHGNGYETNYAHMSKHLVKKGDIIKRGQAIGLVGNTGRSTGSHLHYEIRYNKKTVDPMKYLKVSDLSVSINN